MTFARRMKRIQKKLQDNDDPQPEGLVVPDNHLMLPVGNVLSGPVRGEFLAIPVFGWICRRVRTNTPLIMVTTILITSTEDPTPKGTFQIEMPLYPSTELATLAALEAFGWDGRVWPEDKGWPDGDSAAEDNLKALMAQAQLKSTLTFPAYESGSSAQKVNISRAQGAFLMPELPSYEGEPDPERLAKFRELCEKSSFFLLKRYN